jgi:hypothetical protein
MHIRLEHIDRNLYSINAILIKGTESTIWLDEINRMGFTLHEINAFVINKKDSQEIYGCVVVFEKDKKKIALEKNQYLQLAYDKIIVPCYTEIYPSLTSYDLSYKLNFGLYLLHPETGFQILENSINWKKLTFLPQPSEKVVTKAILSEPLPSFLKAVSYQLNLKKVSDELEENPFKNNSNEKPPFDIDKVMKGSEKEIDKFLAYLASNPDQAMKYAIPLDLMGSSRGSNFVSFKFSENIFSRIASWFSKFTSKLIKNTPSSESRLPTDSSKATGNTNGNIGLVVIGGLFLIFIIYLTIQSTKENNRGVFNFLFSILKIILIFYVVYHLLNFLSERTYGSNFQKKMLNSENINTLVYGFIRVIVYLIAFAFVIMLLTVFTKWTLLFFLLLVISFTIKSGINIGSSRRDGIAIIENDRFNKLLMKYNELAENAIKHGDYQKAAYVYLKLLKTPIKAADTLKQGKDYIGAATIYETKCQNNKAAAECYALGKQYNKAIELYKKMNEYVLIGDLYIELSKVDEANVYYNMKVDELLNRQKYLDASEIQKVKIKSLREAQNSLLTGWRKNAEDKKCLLAYFNNFSTYEEVQKAIDYIYKNELNTSNKDVFLEVLREQYIKDPCMENFTQKIAHELIIELSKKHKNYAQRLRYFDKDNGYLTKDLLRFKKYLY